MRSWPSLVLAAWLCIASGAGCSSGRAMPGDDDDPADSGAPPADAPPDSDRPPPPPPPPLPDDAADGPAEHLLIDDSIHPGGVWGEPLDFRMADYPLSWAIATVHASLLLRSHCINYSPNAVLSVALKESRLGCATPGSLSIPDGCFQIESTTAYVELQRIFGGAAGPGRFAAPHADTVAGDHFETSSLAMVHYLIFSVAMLRKYSTCPEAFFSHHPDVRTQQKVLSALYNRGLWWNSIPTIINDCANRDVIQCFNHDIATDYAHALVDYTKGLDAVPPFDGPVAWDDLEAYWRRIKPLYADADDARVLAALRRAFDASRGGAPTVSFHGKIRVVLRALIEALPRLPTVDDAATGACAQSYLMGAACEPGGACPSEACPDDVPLPPDPG